VDNGGMRRTVLIVEDKEHFASALEIALLAIPNVSVAQAATGREALDFLRTFDPSGICALVTDLHMPVMDGFELVEQVRSDSRYTQLPIIVLSGDTDPDTPDRVCRLGANAYFSKPYSPSEVREKLEELLNAYAP
jgi:CheY-like chemotaxis protein